MFNKKYFVRNTALNTFLWCFDLISLPLKFLRTPKKKSREISRLIVANGAHLGDMVLLIASVQLLKKKYPFLEIALVTGSWNKVLLSNTEIFDDVYYVDHWRLNRSNVSVRKKIITYITSFIRGYRAIRTKKYEVAIDTYHFFPNSSVLLYLSNIPIRIGWRSGGGENLFTQSCIWLQDNKSIAEYHVDILSDYFPKMKGEDIQLSSFIRLPSKLYLDDLSRYGRFVIVHPGAGDNIKLWDEEEWQKLIEILLKRYDSVILTGVGDAELKLTHSFMGPYNVYNLCNSLSISEFSYHILKAECVVCLDSFAGHLSAQYSKPTFVVIAGINNPFWWKPLNDNCYLLSQEVDCSPCFLSTGCESMQCIKGVNANKLDSLMRVKGC